MHHRQFLCYSTPEVHKRITASSSPGRSLSFLPGHGIPLLCLAEVIACYCRQYGYVPLLFLPTTFTLLSQKMNYIFSISASSFCIPSLSAMSQYLHCLVWFPRVGYNVPP